jgi:hypothetical protein
VLPLNKKIWTPSFALVSAGISCAHLAITLLLTDRSGWMTTSHDQQTALSSLARKCFRAVVNPLVWLGRNPLLVFLGMLAIEIVLLIYVKAHCADPWAPAPPGLNASFAVSNGTQPPQVSIWLCLTRWTVAPWAPSAKFASLFVSLVHLACWTAIAGMLDRRKWYLRL